MSKKREGVCKVSIGEKACTGDPVFVDAAEKKVPRGDGET